MRVLCHQQRGAAAARAAPQRSGARAVCRAAPRQPQQQQQQQPPPQQRSALALGAAAAAAALSLLLPGAPALAARAPAPVVGELAQAIAPALAPDDRDAGSMAEDVTEDFALPPELMRFMETTTKGPVKNARQLSELRRSVGFDRSPDGRVFLFSEDGEPFAVKNDMGVPGLLLLRDAGGYCYYLPRSEAGSLAQIDLSDDAVVAQLFANHAWEELVEPLEVVADAPPGAAPGAQPPPGAPPGGELGRLEQLRLTEREFRSVVSLAAGAQELPEEPLEDLDAAEH
ncbi:hypothetical protein HT031_000941 [Scenedesmus sp. PABB004]|nr:hypothetical protein HT031_000941 [Scenedesmus sp. PABB004]